MRTAHWSSLIAFVILLSPIGLAAKAAAQTSEPSVDDTTAALDVAAKATRRHGFVIGAMGGLQLVSASGTNMKYVERGDGMEVGTGLTAVPLAGTLFLGRAFTDWFSFHLGGTASTFSRGGLQMTRGAMLFRVEAFPLFEFGGAFRDLGVGAEFGTGFASIKRQGTGEKLADGSAFSLVGGNVFWEAARFGGLRAGPFVSYTLSSSDTFENHTGWIGLRMAFYAGP